MAVCLGPEYEYTLVKTGGQYLVMARELADVTMKAAGISDYEFVGSFTGKELEYMKVQHPLYDRQSLVIVGDHVTLDSGTGCVHTAPGFGVEDFEVCKNYPELPIIVPVDGDGKLTQEAGEFAGLTTDEANKAIAIKLDATGALLAMEKIVHQYPHCWRCKKPIIFRATEQWFCSVDGFKDEAIQAIHNVKWIPDWGEGRIVNMVRDPQRLVHLPAADLGCSHPHPVLQGLRQAHCQRHHHRRHQRPVPPGRGRCLVHPRCKGFHSRFGNLRMRLQGIYQGNRHYGRVV